MLAGARDLDPPELVDLDQAPILRTTVEDLDAGVLPAGSLYLHVDLDVVDPADLPGLRYPAPHGPALAAVVRAVARITATGAVAAIGIACTWHPGVRVDDAVRAHLESLLADWKATPISQTG